MSPVLGAVASVMNVVGCFEKGPRLALGRMRIAMGGERDSAGIGRASAKGNPTEPFWTSKFAQAA
jgi:hypothetical protein